ncbi:ribosome hibernation-promoting factor, HPF/YfiA family [Anaerococcus prevotii]|uniref:Ribosome hibernation promoting factor n=1 Tax=Anaerococcus prevotii ACS-065-V-Col13 TaxID=879305 RepID=F0GWY3_9FIRM|nr:ribosome-associated translation inhibitor RaiA [Anaerococcus prevotii]EGC81676.1 ribosomal subunit interface protein [Anaerococcus prevotii ACS-065-V-Col13]MDU5149224.1 ribosome-associated translation inhibitor RaiA [Anaerococcus prevotii]
MKLNLIAKNFTLTDDIRNESEKKFDRLDKYFHDQQEMDVRFAKEGNDFVVETTAILDGGKILRSETTDPTYQTAIDKNIDGLVRQIRKNKTKLMRDRQSGQSIKFDNFDPYEDDDDKDANIVRKKEIHVKPMSAEEAILQMELLDHNFFVYLDADDMQVRVVYRRKKGDYGQIIPHLD